MNRREYAISLFKEGYNCSQSVFAAYCELFGIDRNTGLKLASSFGGGIGRMREVCGCFSGIAMIAGLVTGSTDGHDQEQKGRNYQLVQELAEEYKKRAGGTIICKELLGLERAEGSYVPSKRTGEYYKKRPCVELVGVACDIIEEFILDNEIEE